MAVKDEIKIAVIIITFNEETNLEAALDSAKQISREIYIVDSFSTDRTVDIALARQKDDVYIVQHQFDNYAEQWNWAISHLPVKSEWTLKLDADERVTPAFTDEANMLINCAQPQLEGIYFRRRIKFMGTWLKHGGVSNNYDLRMWRTGKAHFDNRNVNEHPIVSGATCKIKSFIEHHSNKSLTDWLEKHNKYSSLEAISIIDGNISGGIKPELFGKPDQRRAWLRKFFYRIPGRTLLYFLYCYLFKSGFLDGYAGFRYAFLHASFFYWINLKLSEFKLTGLQPEIIKPVRGAPHPALMKSKLQKQVNIISTEMDRRPKKNKRYRKK